MLFAKRLAGAAYTLNDAQGFITWAKQGWQEQTHFVFLLMQRTGSVVGAADIKSNQLQAAEIGYWLSAECPGVMTHAVIELSQIARQAGYQSLYARVKERNAQSIGVLARAGFAHCRNFTQDGELYRRYEKHL
jgi:RimJ/RimL family protein N-acetyltransferase